MSYEPRTLVLISHYAPQNGHRRMTTVGTRQAAKLFKLAAVIVALFGLSAVPAAAVTTIDFSGSGSGTVSWAGGSSPLVGSGIVITSVSGSAGLANSPTPHIVTSGVLSFTTGAYTGLGSDGFYNFAAGGSLTITGGVPDANIAAGSVLLSAVNVAAQFNPSYGPSGFQFNMTIPFGTDTKNPDLLSYFGLTPSNIFTFSGTLTGPAASAGLGGFTASVRSADVLNAVPTPSSLLLLGSALLGVGLMVSRKVMGQRT